MTSESDLNFSVADFLTNFDKLISAIKSSNPSLRKLNFYYQIGCDVNSKINIQDLPCSSLSQLVQAVDEVLTNLEEFSAKLKFQIKDDSNNSDGSTRMGNNDLRCKSCRKKFSAKLLMANHMEKVHGIVINYEDPIIDTPEEEEVVPTDFHCCQICYLTFRQLGELDLHNCIVQHQNSCSNKTTLEEKDRTCCSNITTLEEKDRRIRHFDIIKKHNRFICGYCKDEFRQFSRISFHLSKCSGGPFKCQLCHLLFDDRKNLIEHKKSDHKNEKAFACPECHSKFHLNTSLQKHIIQKHEKQQRNTSYQCDRCPKKFIKKVYLTHHKTRFHNLLKPFLCQICGEGFLTTKSLGVHHEIHLGIKKFQCSYCSRQFRRKDKLDAHLTIHTGLRPFACGQCQKYFATKSKLSDHQRRHMGEKRFSCLVCNKMYSGPNDLRNHLKKSHPNISKNLKPNVPLASQILDNLRHSDDPMPQ